MVKIYNRIYIYIYTYSFALIFLAYGPSLENTHAARMRSQAVQRHFALSIEGAALAHWDDTIRQMMRKAPSERFATPFWSVCSHLDCYWVGSLDFNCLGNQGFPLNPPKS